MELTSLRSVNVNFLFHSSIENNEGKLVLTPKMDGDTYVNGQVLIPLYTVIY